MTNSIINHIADKAHQMLISHRLLLDPRPYTKTTTDQDWIKKYGTDIVDLSKSTYEDLPTDWKSERDMGATIAFEKVTEKLNQKETFDESDIEEIANILHEKWLERNNFQAEELQKMQYSNLSEYEKEKDRIFVKATLQYIPNLIPVYTDVINTPREGVNTTQRKGVILLIKHWNEDKYLLNSNEKFGWAILLTGGIEGDEDPVETAKRELVEESGYKNTRKIEVMDFTHYDNFYRLHKGDNAMVKQTNIFVELENGEQNEIDEKEKELHQFTWETKEDMLKKITHDNHRFVVNYYLNHSKKDFDKIFKSSKSDSK